MFICVHHGGPEQALLLYESSEVSAPVAFIDCERCGRAGPSLQACGAGAI